MFLLCCFACLQQLVRQTVGNSEVATRKYPVPTTSETVNKCFLLSMPEASDVGVTVDGETIQHAMDQHKQEN